MISSDFAQACGVFMAKDRPDLWDVAKATSDVVAWSMRLDDAYEQAEDQELAWTLSIGTGGFELIRTVEKDDDEIIMVEWRLSRSIYDFSEWSDGEDDTFDWTTLSHIINPILSS